MFKLELLDRPEVEHVDTGFVQGYAETLTNFYTEHDIDIAIGEINVGPRFTQIIVRPTDGTRPDQLLEFESELAEALGGKGLRLAALKEDKRLISVEIANPEPLNTNLYETFSAKSWREEQKNRFSFILGLDASGRLNCGDLEKYPHYFLYSRSDRSGKTNIIYNLILSLVQKNEPSELHFIAASDAYVDFVRTKYLELASSNSEAIERAVEILKARRAGGVGAEIVLLLDGIDAEDMNQNGAKLHEILDQGARYGVHLVLACASIKKKLADKIPGKILLGAKNSNDVTALGFVGSTELLGSGDMLYLRDEEAYRLQAPLCSKDELGRITANLSGDNNVEISEDEDEDKDLDASDSAVEIPIEDGSDEDADNVYARASQICRLLKRQLACDFEVSSVDRGYVYSRYYVLASKKHVIEKLPSLKDELKRALAVKNLFIELAPEGEKRGAAIEIPNLHSELLSCLDFSYIFDQNDKVANNLELMLGVSLLGEVRHITLTGNCLVYGADDSGKSNFFDLIYLSAKRSGACDNLRMLMFTNRVDAKKYAHFTGFSLVSSDISEFYKALTDLNRHIEHTKTDPQSAEAKVQYLIFLDEFLDNPEFSEGDLNLELLKLLRDGPHFGLHFIISSARASEFLIKNRKLFKDLVLFAGDEELGLSYTGMAGASELKPVGDIFYKSESSIRPEHLSVPLVADEDIETLDLAWVSHGDDRNGGGLSDSEKAPSLKLLNYDLEEGADSEALRRLMESPDWRSYDESKLAFILGKNTEFGTVLGDFNRSPHLVLSGDTKNSQALLEDVLVGLLYRNASYELGIYLNRETQFGLCALNDTCVHFAHRELSNGDAPELAMHKLSSLAAYRLAKYYQDSCYDIDAYKAKLGGLKEAAYNQQSELLRTYLVVLSSDEARTLSSSDNAQASLEYLLKNGPEAGIHLVIAGPGFIPDYIEEYAAKIDFEAGRPHICTEAGDRLAFTPAYLGGENLQKLQNFYQAQRKN